MIKTIEFGEDVVDSYKEYLEVIENIINNEQLTDSEKISAIVKKFQNRKEFIPKLAEMKVFSDYSKSGEIFSKFDDLIYSINNLIESNKNSGELDNYMEDLESIFRFYDETIKEVSFNGR